MQKIIEKVIESKNYELSDMLRKIDTLWVQGSIDDTARKTLSDKARNNAITQNSVDILAKLEEMDMRLKVLEKAAAGTGEETPEETIPAEYIPGKWYYDGDRVSFEGKIYECSCEKDLVCIWSPAEYPVFWNEVVEV